MTLQKLFLTFFGSGLGDKAPGTVGTLAALPVGLLILHYFGNSTLFMLIVVVTIIGVIEVNKYEKSSGIHDDKHIVIDEAVGIWITLLISLSISSQTSIQYVEAIAIVLSFLTFRLFDIWKPSTIGTIDQKWSGGLGVMLDDVLAGIAGGALTILILKAIEWISIHTYPNLLSTLNL